MPRAGYYSKVDGKRLVSVTTVTGLYGDKGGIIYEANRIGREEDKDLSQWKEKTASPGSMCHEHIRADIHEESWTPDHWFDRFGDEEAFQRAIILAQNGFEGYQDWKDQTKMTLIAGEISLVSEVHRFGGTLDAIGTNKGVALLDWKTGPLSIYVDMLYQVGGGYGILWDENMPDKPIEGGHHILRVSRETADFAHYHFKNLDAAREGFLLLRRMYDINKELKKRI